ncbi:dynamin family protein [Bacillus mesophilum]|uniref:Dynamin family protein n=1 Tax=Bacillus mesophilum TaxID=1071718 RepID=A0A7V7RMP1_9BACI|nr:dynamin family protein [Bacillus mesophilum]KAB2333618.1 Dynamin family protein [Bacillus mesophilum]
MIQTELQQLDKNQLMEKITSFYQYFHNNADVKTAERAKDLAQKLHKEEYAIAFCGHFSAGKSSMINSVAGENLLPSSPIPTSANLVKIKAGDDYAKVYFKSGAIKLYEAPYDYEKIKKYSKDGDQIQSVEISHSQTSLPAHAIVMDTPGIDSTDDAHRIATESAMHLADVVFYVMDYNHVQAELNFLFTKELVNAGKKVYLVINQIDKHREEELSFEQFQNGVRESFASWGVIPDRIFYTTLKENDHPHNEFTDLQNNLQNLLKDGRKQLPQSIYHSLEKLMKDHHIWLEEQNADQLDSYERVLAALNESERALVPEKLQEINKIIDEKKKAATIIEADLNDQVDEILKSAYMMPFQTRELAENYLQAEQPDFKVGLFFSKQKTLAEKEQRLTQFYDDFSDKVNAQINWHLRQFLQKTLKELEINNDTLYEQAQQFEVKFDKSLLSNTVKTGARLSGDYVLQYTNDVAENIKKIAKSEYRLMRDQIITSIKKKGEKQLLQLSADLAELKRYDGAIKEVHTVKEQLKQARSYMNDLLSGAASPDNIQITWGDLIADEEANVEIVTEEYAIKEEKKHSKKIIDQPEAEKAAVSQQDTSALVEKLLHTSTLLADVPGFKTISEQLIIKADRIKNQQFTVALFGAFSAGKSSFANALIGEKVLPVSPNPTTAAINKIMPIDTDHGHGTVLVYVKKEDILFQDINESLKVFGLSAFNLSDALQKINKIFQPEQQFEAYEKTHFAFLKAFSQGFSEFQNNLGEMITTNLSELADYVAKEEKSCFVDLIEVYYDCPLTRSGITLVDTPGADSINARHTGVAFNYIKNSDAILFVTYYNHAFSKADREFLIQLGRVKDSFELDKMFFIVNAIDLANNEDELEDVRTYVKEQLTQYGVRLPSVYGVSSLLALEQKKNNKSLHEGMQQFEERFYSFIHLDLMNISILSAKREQERSKEQLNAFISSAMEDQSLKEQKIQALAEEQQRMQHLLKEQRTDLLQKRFAQEADELTFYIKQRVFLRFNDFVKESFNPSLLKDDGRNLKRALEGALEDFLKSFGFDFAQEMRATSLRAEVFIGKILQEQYERLMNEMKEINQNISFTSFEKAKFEPIEFTTAFSDLDQQMFKKALSYFKNPKAFFEKNERKLLADALQTAMEDPALAYLQKEGERLKDHYHPLLANEYSRLANSMLEQTSEYYNGILSALSNQYPIEKLYEIEKQIS